ncbi:GGDEF domain-containing protein [Lactococcus garvieae]|uniref:GGDEF domain-containing protein n=1 Tax=Lactococcus garvieae TaxID=1363 RepID=UPI0018D90DAD|nr:GGDEF domain-containing protein [Lactococcus garvieae]QPS70390.1 GGDEF domain-containing protein [Lactococcus garvieae]
MIHIEDILGSNFIDKIFLMPTVLGIMFIAKYMIQYYQLDQNKITAYILNSSNFALFIILLKFLFSDIDQGSPYGYLISDISLVFIAISVVYLVTPLYKNIEYEILPQFIIYYLLYLHVYGFHLRSTLLVLSGLTLFWLVIYALCNYRKVITAHYISYFFLSVFITLAAVLVAISQFHVPISYTIGIFFKILAVLVIAKVAIYLISIIALMYSDLKRDAYIDILTGTYNRKKFEDVLNEVLFSKNVPSFSIALFDIDAFKSINDNYGHLAGDYVLREISTDIRELLMQEHSNGQLFRYGGDEFFIVFRNQTGEEAYRMMTQITKNISDKEFAYNDIPFNVSISVGVAEITDEKNPETIIDKVDKNLYVAKANGKNQVYYV